MGTTELVLRKSYKPLWDITSGDKYMEVKNSFWEMDVFSFCHG